VIEEEVGFTLADYEAQKKAKAQGLYKKVEGRQHEKIDAKNIKESDFVHNERQTTFQTQLSSAQSYAVKVNEGAQLLGFQPTQDDGEEYEARRGGRGGKGARGDRPRQDRPQTQRGGRKTTKFVGNNEDFPAL
jgi:DNA polymerase sigma